MKSAAQLTGLHLYIGATTFLPETAKYCGVDTALERQAFNF
jgi:hypothetical protein